MTAKPGSLGLLLQNESFVSFCRGTTLSIIFEHWFLLHPLFASDTSIRTYVDAL
jgi:hypothetical protein